MDKKSKKRLTVLRQKLQKLRQLIAAEKQQPDDPSALQQLQAEYDQVSREVEQIDQSK